MMIAVETSRVIYVGETHDNIEAHKVQLRIIKKLSERYSVAIGLEMFRRSAQKKLDRWNKGQLPLKEFKKLFHANWGPGYKLYQPIFDFAQANKLPLIGLKSTRKVEKSFRSGDLAPDGAFYPELDDQDPYHRAFSMAAFGGHRGTEKALEKPYRMLLLWEETMAQTVSQFLMNSGSSSFPGVPTLLAWAPATAVPLSLSAVTPIQGATLLAIPLGMDLSLIHI